MPDSPASIQYRSYVISWNLTRKCNLECDHCYISASPFETRENELNTEECFRVIDQIREVSPGAVLILTGGEPLLRRDIYDIAKCASDRGFLVVMGTNGTLVTEGVIEKLKAAGVQGVGISIDSLDPEKHNLFRGIPNAWQSSVRAMALLRNADLPFLIQTTVVSQNIHEIPGIIDFACDQGAKVFNLYFLVPTGRGKFITHQSPGYSYFSNISPEQYEGLLKELLALQPKYRGRMLINAKCAPHFQRVLWENDPESPYLKGFQGAGGCPAGTHYSGITPEGDVTPCPYLPVYGGNVREQSFADIWNASDVFVKIRDRNRLGGKCGPCEFSAMCSGCRARAYGQTGDYLAEDAGCGYTPGAHGGQRVILTGATTYGLDSKGTLRWSPEAARRMEAVPAFVRGMVTQKIEEYARENQIAEITPEFLDQARERMMPGGRVIGIPVFAKKESKVGDQ
ncbi:MAG: radical SAM protein [bacterium]